MKLIQEVDFIKLDSDRYIMVNLINAATDIISIDLYERLITGQFDYISADIKAALIDRKYLFRTEGEYQDFLSQLNAKIDQEEQKSIPTFLVIPTYNCNLRCIYCYEQTYEIQKIKAQHNMKILLRQLDNIDKIVSEFKVKNTKDVKVVLMGGEPLLAPNKEMVVTVFKRVYERGYSLSIVSNGVDLDSFIEEIIQYNISSIQITLDGTKDTHDKRRIFHDGTGSFDLIIKNIKKAIENKIIVNLRVNVDASNIDDLPNLANMLVDKLGNFEYLRPYIYLLQDGGCSGNKNIVDEQQAIDKINDLEALYPNMAIFDKKYHGSDFINAIFEDRLYQPVLRHCGAAKNQYIFDIKGNIYKCWHGIGCEEYKVGTFDENIKMDAEKETNWKNRNALVLEKCRHCKYRYICGTGCPATETNDKGIFDETKEACVDYKKILETQILNRLKKVTDDKE